jgi:hypothetical protein
VLDLLRQLLLGHGQSSIPKSASVCRIFARLASDGGTIGRR